MVHKSVDFHLNHLKLSIWKLQFIKKNCRSNLYWKLQNEEVIQDGATHHCFILSGLAELFLNRFQHLNLFWSWKIKHFYIPQARKNSFQNGVNIQDGDFTIIYPSVWALYLCHFQTYNHQILNSYRRLYKNQWHVWVFWFIVY
jgi:hypothetical protein